MKNILFLIIIIPLLSFSQKKESFQLKADFTDYSDIHIIDDNSSRENIQIEINGIKINAQFIDSSHNAIYDTLYHKIPINEDSFDTIKYIRTYFHYIDSTHTFDTRTYTNYSLAKFRSGCKYVMYYNSCCSYSLYPKKTRNVRGVVKFEILNSLDTTYKVKVGIDIMTTNKAITDFNNYHECAMCYGSPNTICVDIDTDSYIPKSHYIRYNFLHREMLVVTFDEKTKSYKLKIAGHLKKKWDYKLYEK